MPRWSGIGDGNHTRLGADNASGTPAVRVNGTHAYARTPLHNALPHVRVGARVEERGGFRMSRQRWFSPLFLPPTVLMRTLFV